MSLRERQLMRFVIGIGLVSFFADFTYEGGRSILGPYFAFLGASPILVGLVSGVGEFLGYAIRLFSGRYVDRSRNYWLLIAPGYILNLLSVPVLGLVSNLTPAIALTFTERLGKGLRNPPRDTLLSQAGEEIGHGRAFGIHELLDQSGAFLGPLAVAGAVAYGSYRFGFAILLFPGLLSLALLCRAKKLAPAPKPTTSIDGSTSLSNTYFRYLVFSALAVMGFANFALVSYHLAVAHLLPPTYIPLLYALAMGVDALAALGIGRLFDQLGFRLLYAAPLLILLSADLLFTGKGLAAIALGAVFWGGAMGIQETAMRAGVAHLTPEARRAGAYGLFDTVVFGFAWMIGSGLMGWFYSQSSVWVVLFSAILQVVSIPFLLWTLAGARRRA